MLYSMSGSTNSIYNLIGLPNGILASGPDNYTIFWDYLNGLIAYQYYAITTSYNASTLTLLLNGNVAAATYNKKNIAVINSTTGILSFTLIGHSGGITKLLGLSNGWLVSLTSFNIIISY